MTSSIQPASRQPDDTRSADWITDQIAMQQEMETLRHALSVKSSKLDAITEAFGTLEDRLEDQHQAYDALRKSMLRDRLRVDASGPLMAVLPPGRLTMGARGLMPEYGEHPVHRVRISGFLIGVNEVTFAEYDRFVRATGRRLPDDFGWGRDRRPVVDVSWTDALAYTRWLSGQTGKRSESI